MNRSYFITLPRNIKVDIFDLPDNFDDTVRETFREYTECTSKDYTYQDKLGYIDCFIEKLNKSHYASDVVDDMVEAKFKYSWEECGELLSEDDIFCKEFMEECYECGKRNAKLYSHFGVDDHHIYDQIMRALVKVITIVMNYDGKVTEC
jgi:hypothetical protein